MKRRKIGYYNVDREFFFVILIPWDVAPIRMRIERIPGRCDERDELQQGAPCPYELLREKKGYACRNETVKKERKEERKKERTNERMNERKNE